MNYFLKSLGCIFLAEKSYRLLIFRQQTIIRLSGAKTVGGWGNHRAEKFECSSRKIVRDESAYIPTEIDRLVQKEWTTYTRRQNVQPTTLWIKHKGRLFGKQEPLKQ